MRIAEGWVTAARGPTLSAAAVATVFLRNDLRDAFIIFLPSPEAYARSVATVIEVGAESTPAWVGQDRGFGLLPIASVDATTKPSAPHVPHRAFAPAHVCFQCDVLRQVRFTQPQRAARVAAKPAPATNSPIRRCAGAGRAPAYRCQAARRYRGVPDQTRVCAGEQ